MFYHEIQKTFQFLKLIFLFVSSVLTPFISVLSKPGWKFFFFLYFKVLICLERKEIFKCIRLSIWLFFAYIQFKFIITKLTMFLIVKKRWYIIFYGHLFFWVLNEYMILIFFLEINFLRNNLYITTQLN